MDVKEIIQKLRTYSTPELCDGMTNVRCLDYTISRKVTDKNIVGQAFTIEVPYGVSGIIPEALKLVEAGQVLVIAGGGCCNRSYWGDHRSICAAIKSVEGVVIDGSFRDIDGCIEAGVPIYARGVIPVSAKKESIGQLNVPIRIGEVEIFPGDIIVGDANGVCVIAPEEAQEIMDRAKAKMQAQEKTIERMRRTGEFLPRVIWD